MGRRFARTFLPICEAAPHTRCPSAAAGAPGCSLFCGSGHRTGWRWQPSRVCPLWAPTLWFRQAARPRWSPGLCLGAYEMEWTIVHHVQLQFAILNNFNKSQKFSSFIGFNHLCDCGMRTVYNLNQIPVIYLFIFYFRLQSENSLKDKALYCLVQLRCSDCDHACLRINSCQIQKQNTRGSRAGEESRWWVNGNTYISSPKKLCEVCGVFFPNSFTAFSSTFCERSPKQCILREQRYPRRLGS